MPMPTLVKTWQFNVNQALAIAADQTASMKNYLYALKQSFISFASNPWEVVRSSNGVTASDSDLWTGTGAINFSFTLPSGGASARSWIVLKNPNIGGVNGFQILLDCIMSNGVSWMGLFCSPGAGFTGGTATARPTASDIRQLQTNIDHGVSSNPNWCYTNSSPGWTGNIAMRLHAMMSTDGKCTRILLTDNQGGTPRCTFAAIFDELLNVPDGVNPLAKQWLASNASNVLSNMFYSSGIEGQNLDFDIGGQPTRGTTIAENAIFTQTFANEISNEWPMAPLSAAIYNQVIATAGNLGIVTPGVLGRVGDFADLWWGSSGVASLDTYPGDGSNQFMQFQQLILPWNGSAPLAA